jgi:hypothetical protein
MHGGLSSGAKSPEGKELCRKAAQKGMIEYWKRKRDKTAELALSQNKQL